MIFPRKLLLSVLLLLVFFFSPGIDLNFVSAQSDDKLIQLQEEIARYESELTKLKSQSNTLSNQIAQYDAQIRLTTLKITDTEEKIKLLGGRIDQLTQSLYSLNQAYSERVNETYKMSRVNQPIVFVISADDLSQAILRYHYLKRVQEADKQLLVKLESAQNTYKEEKSDQEDLQTDLKLQKQNLDTQKTVKARLLVVTRNDEKKYQQLLASARAEFEAIQAIISGKGSETEIGKVSEGQRIASVIQGPSCNSSGSHLHFIVAQGSATQNPFSYLSASVSSENCSGSSCGSGDGDPFNPSGSWIWPINQPIKFSQGYGGTWAVRNTWVGRIYSSHNGIDINNEGNSEVKAVKTGTLFRGGYSGSGGCTLRYVRVDHDDSDLDTYYLHINY